MAEDACGDTFGRLTRRVNGTAVLHGFGAARSWTRTPRAPRLRGPGDPAGCVRRGVVPASLGLILMILSGCTSTRGPVSRAETGPVVPGPTPTWSKVLIPPDVEPVTLTAAGPGMLVGGFAASRTVKPRLLRIAADGSSTEVPLIAHSGYAFEARWQSIASDGDRIIAVGGVAGGAHFNTRWTTWAGSSAGVTEIPQPFETFGGWGAGDVIGPVLTSAGPAIAGSWQGAKSGLDEAIWLPVGDRWVRQSSAGSALESTGGVLVGARSATSTGAGILLSGSAVHLLDGKVRQSAAVWRSQRVNNGWARVDLPDSGASGEAVSAHCDGQNCVVAGYVGGAVALWRLSRSAATPIPDVPHVAANPSSPIPAPLVAGARIIEVVSAGPGIVVLAGGDKDWTLSKGPIGEATSSALIGGWVYVIAERPGGSAVLWRCPVKDLG